MYLKGKNFYGKKYIQLLTDCWVKCWVFAPEQVKVKKKIINNAVGGMAREKKVEIKQEGGGYLLEILSQ